tara:strand:+ start:245 stop:1279 length:1035 start_codon:yes stop_codon:yes gene_type:complete
MKLCSVTNYNNKGYINELLICNKLSSTLGINNEDSFTFKDLNSVYHINKNYTHILIYFDYKVTSIQGYSEFLKDITIPKIFIVDTIPHKHKEINKYFVDTFLKNGVYSFTSLSQNLQETLYKKYADGIVLFSDLDKQLFNQFYNIPDIIPKVVIPPPLGKEKDLKINFDNFSPNNLVGYNGVPSYTNGFQLIGQTLSQSIQYNLDVFGTHGREDLNTEQLFNSLLSELPNLHFKGRLKNVENFYKYYHIYLNVSLYDSFDYFTYKSLLNGMVPLLGKNTGTSSFLKSYPFISTPDLDSVKYTLELISKTPPEYLKEILSNTLKDIKQLSDEECLNKYQIFLNSI